MTPNGAPKGGENQNNNSGGFYADFSGLYPGWQDWATVTEQDWVKPADSQEGGETGEPESEPQPQPGSEGLQDWREWMENETPEGIWGTYVEMANADGHENVGEMPDLTELNEAGQRFFDEIFHDLETPLSEEAKQARIEMATKAALSRIGAQEILDAERSQRTGVPVLRTRADDLMRNAVQETRSILDSMYNRNGYLRAEMGDVKLGEDEEIAWKMASEPQKSGNIRSWLLMNDYPRRKGETPDDYEARLKNYARPSVNMDRQKEADEKFEQEHPELLQEKWVIDWSDERRNRKPKVEKPEKVKSPIEAAERADKERSIWGKIRERFGFKKLIDKVMGAFEKKAQKVDPEVGGQDDMQEEGVGLVSDFVVRGLEAAQRKDAELEARKNTPVDSVKLDEMLAARGVTLEDEEQGAEGQGELQQLDVPVWSLGVEAPDLPQKRSADAGVWDDDKKKESGGVAESETKVERRDVSQELLDTRKRIKRVEAYQKEILKRYEATEDEDKQEKFAQALDEAEEMLLELRTQEAELEQEREDQAAREAFLNGNDERGRTAFALEHLRSQNIFEGPYNAEGYEVLQALKTNLEQKVIDTARQAKHAQMMLEDYATVTRVPDIDFNPESYRELVDSAPLEIANDKETLGWIRSGMREMRRIISQGTGTMEGESA